MAELNCQHCGYKWNYGGANLYYATCPRCRYKVKIPKEKTRMRGRGMSSLQLERVKAHERRPIRLQGVAAIVNRIVEEYGYDKSMLIQVLLRLQKSFSWLPMEMLLEVSKQLKVPLSQVYQIATFYKAFSLTPRGRHLVRVCMGTACKVRGATNILEKIQRVLKIERDETTPDGRFTLETINCAGCCALGPVITVDGEYHGNVKTHNVEKILEQYR
ncbi:MAG: NAD(P)H-dependent oxidoreductase subunit E [Candidatus Bathyarchaeia archaeon]